MSWFAEKIKHIIIILLFSFACTLIANACCITLIDISDTTSNFSMIGFSFAYAESEGVSTGNNDVANSSNVTRLWGNEAQNTSAAVALKAFEQTDKNGNITYEQTNNVVVARNDDFADAMSATGLAGALNAPILLTEADVLSSDIVDVISKLGAKNAYIIGGEAAIKPTVATQLKQLDAIENVYRISGNEYWDTSVKCAEAIQAVETANGAASSSDVIVAYGQNFQDALSISSLAYKYHMPVFLTTAGATSDECNLTNNYDTKNNKTGKAEIDSILTDSSTIYVPGGTGAVSESTVENNFAKGTVKRLAGYNGYDTSNVIATELTKADANGNKKLAGNTIAVASGAQASKGVDALSSAALAGKCDGVILLANSNDYADGNAENNVNMRTLIGDDAFLQTTEADLQRAFVVGGTKILPDTPDNNITEILDTKITELQENKVKLLSGNVSITLLGNWEMLEANVSELPNGVVPKYQWYKGDNPIDGETDAHYMLADTDNDQVFKCVVTDASGVYLGQLESKLKARKASAFAFYSETDNSLTFAQYWGNKVPSVGDIINDKIVTAVYTNIDYISGTQPWSDYSNKIEKIDALTNFKLSGNMSRMFYKCTSLTDTSGLLNWDTSAVTNMRGMFSSCVALEDVKGLSNWNTSKVTSMYGMFSNCTALADITGLANWDTSSVTTVYYMFCMCSALTDVSALSKWETGAVTYMNSMFSACSSLVDISGISGWNTSAVINMSEMFLSCNNLTTGNLSSWDVSNVTNHSHFCPSECTIIQPNWVN